MIRTGPPVSPATMEPMHMDELQSPAVEGTSLAIDLEVDPTVNYAIQQNDVPIVKRLRFTNLTGQALEHLRVRITADPAFAHPREHALDRLGPYASADLGVVDIPLSHAFLAQQAEGVRGSLLVTVHQGNRLLAERRASIDVLAYDQWNGTRAIPEILAAFVLPNHPVIEELLRQASRILGEQTGDPSFQGYQRRSKQRVLEQVSAIYEAIRQQGIAYCGLPASFEKEGQKIRTPDRVLAARLGNCLDLSTLFAACLEQAGLHPLIVLVRGHALPGVWLEEECFADSVVDDPSALRKRVKLDEICVLESTLAVGGNTAAFAAAAEAGRRHLDDPATFLFVVDVRRARSSRIRPLPVRPAWTGDGACRDWGTPPASPPAGSRLPDETGPAPASASPAGVPPSDAPPAPVRTSVGADLPTGAVAATPARCPSSSPPPSPSPPPSASDVTPAQRLERWKRKLLDLSLRNQLINLRETRSVVPLLVPDLATLENALAGGTEFELHPRPRDWDGSPRDPELHRRRTFDDAIRSLLIEELGQRRLRCDLDDNVLSGQLVHIYRSARAGLEENGANVLFLALGTLIWYESRTSDQPHRAPILLIPLELQRRSVQSRFLLRRTDEEPMVNVTLLELLRHDFGLAIPDLERLPEDESGVDVRQILDTVRQAIKHIDRWDVAETAHIGLFSFTKLLMWRDLAVRAGELESNKLVASLIHFPDKPFPAAGDFPDPHKLDDDYRPDKVLCPISADSSQLVAICAAAEGKSFVLHGPPGTGKSQTITNIIANALAQGKTVLFVAEKMAALSVVQRRLEAAGLGAFCLELHSSKSRKTDVLAQLEVSLNLAELRPPEDWQAECERLAQLRHELNTYVRALHRPRNTGESLFAGLARLMAVRGAPTVKVDAALIRSVDREGLRRLRDKVRDLAAAGRACGHPAGHAWRAAGVDTWTPQLRDGVMAAIQQMRDGLQRCEEAAGTVATLFGLRPGGWSWQELSALRELAEHIISTRSLPAALVEIPDWEEADAAVRAWITRGRERDRLRAQVYQHYTERLLELDLDRLAADWAVGEKKWLLPRWLACRRVQGALRSALKPGAQVSARQLSADLNLARQLRDQERRLQEADDRARALLGRLWCDGEADWDEVAAALDWAGAIHRIASRLAGPDPLRAHELRRRWAALLAAQPELLHSEAAYGGALQRLAKAMAEVEAARQTLCALLVLDEEQAWGHPGQEQGIERARQTLAAWEQQLAQLRAWCTWRKERKEAEALGLGPLVVAYEEGRLSHDQVEPAFERSFYDAWVAEILGEDEVLRTFSRERFEDKIARFRALDEWFAQLAREEIRARLSANIPRYHGEPHQNSELGILRRELQKRIRHLPLRVLFQKIPNLLRRLKPCLLMSPISVAQYLDPAFPKFDIVVFDEASQVPTWDAVGAIARGHEAIIVGDPKQLPPTNFFSRTDDEEEDGDNQAVEDLESILQDCLALSMPELHLRWHYRSRHESLIAFSNYHYYRNQLLTFPSPVDVSVVSFRFVGGQYDRSKSRTNRAEAEAVVAEVIRRLTSPEASQQSIGVVTFNLPQQRLIEDLLDDARRRMPELEPFFAKEAAEPVFVKNLENVQGDERDVILFSVCYGPDERGQVSVNFGPLNREGGERRLNVAITRARREIVVFSSLLPDQIDLTRTTAEGVKHLKAFLEYAQRGVRALKELVDFNQGAECESPFEQAVYEELVSRGYRVHKQVGCSGYRIDLAVVDPERPGHYVLGIECDGATYHSACTARDRDRLRAEVLRSLGWRLHRIWSTDWWQDREREMARLEAAIQTAIAAARQETVEGGADARGRVDARGTEPEMDPGDRARAPAAAPGRPAAGSADKWRHAATAEAGAAVLEAPAVEAAVLQLAPSDDGGQVPVRPLHQPQLGSHEIHPLATYRPSEARPSLSATAMDFYSAGAEQLLTQLIEQIVREEGPLSLSLLCQRVTPWWGIQRVTRRVEERIRHLARRARIPHVVHDGTLFYWPAGVDPAAYREVRVPDGDESLRRRAEDLPPEEIANAALYVLTGQISLPLEDLVRELARLFGYQRTGHSIDRCLRAGIDLLCQRGDAQPQGTMVVIKPHPARTSGSA